MSLTACGAGVEAPQLRTVLVSRTVPETAKQSCDEPVKLVTGSKQEMRTALARDGVALLECEERRKAAIEGSAE